VQRRNEEALRQSEEQFRQITENLQHMLWIGDVASECFLYVSPAFESIWGRSRSLVLQRPRMLLADIHPGDRERMTAAMQRVWRDEHHMDEEYRLLRQDGATRWLWTRTFPIRDEKGCVYRIGAVTEDITTRREQEEQLRFSEEKFRRLFENSPVGIALVSLDYRLAEVNPAFCHMLGYSREELTSKTFIDITYPEDLDTDLVLARKMFSGEIPFYSMEKRYVRKNGETFWIKLYGTVIRDHRNQPIYGLGMVEDIDQSKRAESIRLAHELAQKNALVREVHHRIKNHLQGVVGLLRRQRHDGSPCNAILEETIAQINTVAMVHGLQGKAAGEEISLVEMVAAISHAVNELIPSSHASLIGNALDFSPVISRDESVPLALALNELLVNARKFSSGPVDIALSGDRNKIVIRITNPTRELPQQSRTSGLELVKALLQTDGVAFIFEHGADYFSAEVCLTQPVLKNC
jgi:PAS domain S-box-containing protein